MRCERTSSYDMLSAGTTRVEVKCGQGSKIPRSRFRPKLEIVRLEEDQPDRRTPRNPKQRTGKATATERKNLPPVPLYLYLVEATLRALVPVDGGN